MRLHLLALVLLASTAAPAVAQQNASQGIDRRIGKLEQEMRAVQRRVFPGGNVEPEIRPEIELQPMPGVPASSATADLTARVDALESQLASLTGQIEQNQYQLRQLEQALTSLTQSTQSRLDAIERPAVPDQPAPAEAPPAIEEEDAGTAADAAASAEDAYNAGFRLWDQQRYGEAQQALEAVAKKYPKHRLASWASNLAGRAYLDDGKPATAAKVLLANYQNDPKGERAADSLFFLGQALVKLQKMPEACKVYDELQDVYGASMRDFLKQRLPQARKTANCD
ncbi:tetratricopeptide repeat protein [Sphingosinicella rhizophila]|uniref:Tetratricopeptide repeat protein n=1 Tax=Sphingosinicella rhizophila TaxID=3050082 RepID=A0ABU3Q440_9SPHN|nr:tetratricopeptide repeat protein [Sphingosinicella sp. GR2756]MDT9598186.1 tetratricopeptide repeat protein [Sphingosinicella sp. GR2756]